MRSRVRYSSGSILYRESAFSIFLEAPEAMLPLKDAMRDENQSWHHIRMFCSGHFKHFPLKLRWKRRRRIGYHVFDAEKGGLFDKRMKAVVVRSKAILMPIIVFIY
jgi:hypothetical protein